MAKASTDEPHIAAQNLTHFSDKYVACLKCQTCVGIMLVLKQLKCFHIKLQIILSFVAKSCVLFLLWSNILNRGI